LTTFKSDSEALADAQPLSPNESPVADEEAMANAKNGWIALRRRKVHVLPRIALSYLK
jgi:hypothetical protein